jgi:hypothetical protein
MVIIHLCFLVTIIRFIETKLDYGYRRYEVKKIIFSF